MNVRFNWLFSSRNKVNDFLNIYTSKKQTNKSIIVSIGDIYKFRKHK